MSVEEVILFVAVIALALALVVVVVGPKLRAGRRKRDQAPAPSAPTAAPADDFAPAAEVPLPPPVPAPVGPPLTPVAAWSHLICPTCRRQFAAGLRFCPYDARMLTADGHTGAPELEGEPGDAPQRPTAKICPSCARRYESVAVVCARDGAPLVSVN
jgi:hypothetical protein